MPEPHRAAVQTIDDLYGPAGRLEALLNTGRPDAPYAVLVAHPHPLGGGTMHNKVVYHAAKAFSSFGLPVLRFNFRGTGLSEGTHDDGRGEQDDIHAALTWLTTKYALPILFCGFSFGSYVGLRACAGDPRIQGLVALGLRACAGDPRIQGLVALGLPVRAEGRDYTYDFLPTLGPIPKLFISGDSDAFSPRGILEAVLTTAPQPKQIIWIESADHFFAGTPQSPASRLGVMSEAIRAWLSTTFAL